MKLMAANTIATIGHNAGTTRYLQVQATSADGTMDAITITINNANH